MRVLHGSTMAIDTMAWGGSSSEGLSIPVVPEFPELPKGDYQQVRSLWGIPLHQAISVDEKLILKRPRKTTSCFQPCP